MRLFVENHNGNPTPIHRTSAVSHCTSDALSAGPDHGCTRRGGWLSTGPCAPARTVTAISDAIQPRQPSHAQLELAERALAAVPGGRDQLLYARVDLVPDATAIHRSWKWS